MWHRSGYLALSLSLSLCGASFILTAAGDSEIDELRAQAKAIQEEAAQHARSGNMEAAKELKHKSAQLVERAEQLGHARDEDPLKARHLKERLVDLQAQHQKLKENNASPEELHHVEREIDEIKTELAERNEHHPASKLSKHPLEHAVRRAQHLKIAAENLKAADMPDLAHEALMRAEAIEKEAAEMKRRFGLEHPQKMPTDSKSPRDQELQAELARLRQDVAQLKEVVQNITKIQEKLLEKQQKPE